MNAETAVRERYAAGAKSNEPRLCCPVEYDSEYLKAIPKEVIERDYGCGDPSKYLREGETVLDLGSGTGKICFIAAQIVGAKGKVIGVDMTDEMLDVARRNAPEVAQRIGYKNVEFRKGRIQDLALDLEKLDAELKARPITDAASFLRADELAQELRVKHPLVASDSVDVVVSNCVLNLVEPKSKRQLFEEIFRVLKKGRTRRHLRHRERRRSAGTFAKRSGALERLYFRRADRGRISAGVWRRRVLRHSHFETR